MNIGTTYLVEMHNYVSFLSILWF